METKYILTETIEGTDGIRDFNILMLSADYQKVLAEKNKLVEADEYGYFKKNDFLYDTDIHTESNFDNGFVSYLITEIEEV